MNSPGKNKHALTILGIDPGSIFCGYGIVSGDRKDGRYIASGRISAPASKPLHYRLRIVYESLTDIIRTYAPSDIVVEDIFFAKSARAALQLGHARGMVLLAAASEGIDLHEFSALQVKKAVVGYGRAEKSQVQEMVKMILHIKGELYPDSADALALALCYLNTIKFNNAVLSAKR
ncbi:MAG: crossover junction endodeoxyribonuclease RuvC [Thermodesulfovibrionales bacterium]